MQFLKTAIFCAAISILFLGCSKDKSETIKPPTQFLGERLLALVGSEPNVSPLPQSIKDAVSECKFDPMDGGAITFSNNCTILKSAPNRTAVDEKGVSITAETPNCCLGAVMVSQSISDMDGGLFLFSNLKGVTTKPLQCDNMEDAKLSLVEQDGKPKFVIAEYVSSGSGSNGTNVDTAIFYGRTTLDCDYFAAKEKALYQAHNSTLKKPSVAASTAPSNSKGAEINNPAWCYGYNYEVARLLKDTNILNALDRGRPKVENKFNNGDPKSINFAANVIVGKTYANDDLRDIASNKPNTDPNRMPNIVKSCVDTLMKYEKN